MGKLVYLVYLVYLLTGTEENLLELMCKMKCFYVRKML